MSLALVLSVVATFSQVDTDDETREREVELWRKAFARQAAEYAIVGADAPDEPLTVIPKPVFIWNQPVRFNQTGSVFVWVHHDGRLGVIGTIYAWKLPAGSWAHSHEFHSLSPVPLQIVWRGDKIWTPQKPGLHWKDLPNAPEPGASVRIQTRQMRLLARKFNAHTLDPAGQRWELRLLSKPLHEYVVGADDKETAGGLFAMCQGSDPELLLTIECRPVDGTWRWQYACGAFTDRELRVELQNEEVWKAEATTVANDTTAVYWRTRITSLAQLPSDAGG